MEVEVAVKPQRRLVSEVALDYGLAFFDDHPSGIRLASEGLQCLRRAIDELSASPTWTVLLEGHCPGNLEDNDDILESVGEEAADLCKEQLLREGVRNDIICKGLGSTEGLGMHVRLSLVEPDAPPTALAPAGPPEAQPAVEKRQGDVIWGQVFGQIVQPAEKATEAPTEVDDMPIPDLEGLSDGERLPLLEELVLRALPSGGIEFDANNSQILEMNMPLVRRLVYVLKAFPDFGLQCAGHAKGKPADNKLMKRVLAQDRALALQDALRKEGVMNSIACVGFGSALGRGNCVRVHAMMPGQADAEDAELMVLGWNTGSLSIEQERESLNQLLQEALERGLSFEPNKATIKLEAAPTVRRVAWVLKAFPTWTVSCEGHTKGKPEDSNDMKLQLSLVRAEALRSALEEQGVQNTVVCAGHGCAKGLGMCVQMCAVDPDKEMIIPDLSGLSEDERRDSINELLAQALERGIDFEPNKHYLPPSALGLVRIVARVLKAFPDVAFRLEGHAKGSPQENNEAKRRLSLGRAEAVRAAVKLEGALNAMLCVGEGSALGRGAGLRMLVVDAEELRASEVKVPDLAGLSREAREEVLNELLETSLQKGIDFEPNSSEVPLSGMEAVRNVAKVLQAFADFDLLCEGHAKGQPAENNAAKKKLSHQRAQAFKTAVLAEGATSCNIKCVGRGCEVGLGTRLRMFVADPKQALEGIVEIPDASGLSREEQEKLLNRLLSKALEKGTITFEPNSVEIEITVADTIAELARILKEFPDFAVRCEGHTKGKPVDNNAAKMKLSQARAESVRTALQKLGVAHRLECAGRGCALGLGMCVRMFSVELGDPSEPSPPGAPGAGAPAA